MNKNKIDEIIEQGKRLHEVTNENVELMLAREDTNQEMISFIREIINRVYPKVDNNEITLTVIKGLTESLNNAIANNVVDAENAIIQTLLDIEKTSSLSPMI